ncbi:unnamed protein product [Caenorhabditis nigoni]
MAQDNLEGQREELRHIQRQNEELERIVERNRQNLARLNEQERGLNENLQLLNQRLQAQQDHLNFVQNLPPWPALPMFPPLPRAPLNEREQVARDLEELLQMIEDLDYDISLEERSRALHRQGLLPAARPARNLDQLRQRVDQLAQPLAQMVPALNAMIHQLGQQIPGLRELNAAQRGQPPQPPAQNN